MKSEDNFKGILNSRGKPEEKGINHCKEKKSHGEHRDGSVPSLKQTLLSDSGALQHSGSHSSSIQGCCLYCQFVM